MQKKHLKKSTHSRIKTLNELEIERGCLNIIKPIYKKPAGNIPNSERLPSLLSSGALKILTRVIIQENKETHPNGKENVKFVLMT